MDFIQQGLTEADGVNFANLIYNMGSYAKVGAENILHNPFALTCFLLAILAVLLVKRIKSMIIGILLLFALGYGSLVIDGANLVAAGLKDIIP